MDPWIKVNINAISILSHLLLTGVSIYLLFKSFFVSLKRMKKFELSKDDVIGFILIWFFNLGIFVLDLNFVLNIFQNIGNREK